MNTNIEGPVFRKLERALLREIAEKYRRCEVRFGSFASF